MIFTKPALNSTDEKTTPGLVGDRKGLLVMNPVAGEGRPEEIRGKVRGAFSEVAYDVYETTGQERLPSVVQRAVREHRYSWVAVAGGDGTVSQVANGLWATDVPLAIIPAGTGNALAQELGIPDDPQAAFKLLLDNPNRRSIDGIQIDQKLYFLNVGVGLSSAVMSATTPEQKNRWHGLAYIVNAIKKAFGWQPFEFTLKVEGMSHQLAASELVMANAAAVGIKDLALRDDIAPDDGRIDVAAIRARSIVDYIRLVWAFVRRRPREADHIRYFSFWDQLEIELKKPMPVQGDGEPLGSMEAVSAQVVPHALSVLVPGPSAEEEKTEQTEEKAEELHKESGRLDTARYLIAKTFKEWREDQASRLAAALSYYTIFSLPPLIIISLAIAGLVYDRQAAQERLVAEAGNLLGKPGGEAIVQILENASNPELGSIASIISIVILLFGASGVFSQLQGAMNTIWEVRPKPGRGIVGTIKDRLLSFTLVLSIGFLLLVSLILSTALAAASDYLTGLAPEAIWLARLVSFMVTFGGVAFMFALMFKIIPDVKIAWRDVWLGAVVTAILFNVGKWVISLYLGHSAPASTYGAAGSLIVVLLWVYYSAQILFLGAEFTQVYAGRFGDKIVADENAIPLPEAI